MAIGNVLTISPGLVAGSIISGAYFPKYENNKKQKTSSMV